MFNAWESRGPRLDMKFIAFDRGEKLVFSAITHNSSKLANMKNDWFCNTVMLLLPKSLWKFISKEEKERKF